MERVVENHEPDTAFGLVSSGRKTSRELDRRGRSKICPVGVRIESTHNQQRMDSIDMDEVSLEIDIGRLACEQSTITRSQMPQCFFAGLFADLEHGWEVFWCRSLEGSLGHHFRILLDTSSRQARSHATIPWGPWAYISIVCIYGQCDHPSLSIAKAQTSSEALWAAFQRG